MHEFGRNAIEVVAAVISDGDEFLVCRRSPEKSAGGKWEFPGGKVEAGESQGDAIRREIQEELGIEILVGEELTTSETNTAGQTIRLTCFCASLAGPRPTSSTDHDELRWLRATELTRLDWAAPDRPAVKLLQMPRR